MGNNGGMAISGLDKSYNDFIKGSIISVPTGNGTSTPIPNYVWFAILLAAVMWFIWNKTTFGKNMFALGSNEEAARVSGVNVLMTTVLVFAALCTAGPALWRAPAWAPTPPTPA